MEIVKFSFPTEIFFGPKSSKQLAIKLNYLKIKRPLIVTDRGLVSNPIVQNLITDLKISNFQTSLFSGIYGNPTLSHVEDGVKSFHRHDADCIVSIGGGAALDVAKAVGLMAFHPGNLFDYEDGKADCLEFNKPMPYLVAIPTTSGTGSEVGRSTVISDNVTKTKKVIFHPILLPKLVLADPELTLGLPDKITAATGMDALSHLLESFIAKGFHPMCDGIALEGLRILADSLPKAVKAAKKYPEDHDENLKHRGQMMTAALMGAVAFQKGLGVTHSCAHALSAVCDLHHGLANGIMLPYAMAFNLPFVTDKFCRVAETLHLGSDKPQAVVDYLKNLQEKIEIPQKLSNVGVQITHLNDLVEAAVKDGCHLSNPCLVDAKDFRRIFENAL